MVFKPGQSGNPKGRPKGEPNKATKAREEAISRSGLTPLDFMLQTLRNPKATAKERQWAAANAAPYVHPRLSQIQANHSGQIDVRAWLLSLGEPDK